MASPDAKSALLEVLSGMLEGDRHMGEMADVMPALSGYLRAFGHPDLKVAMVPIPPGPIVEYDGVDGLAQAWEDWGGTFESVRADAEEVRQAERSVALFVNQIAVTKHDGVEISQPSAMLWLFDGPLVSRLEFHLDRAAALKAGGF